MTIKEINELFKNTKDENLEKLCNQFCEDNRTGVQKILASAEGRIKKFEKELLEYEARLALDESFHNKKRILVGIDEVGRGPLAGPVVACAVILPYDVDLFGIKDSKKLSKEQREIFYEKIMEQAISVGIGLVEHDEIDKINILQATFKAMREALLDLKMDYDVIAVDGNLKIEYITCEQHTITKGDDKSVVIAAASIVAKVTRDRIMNKYSEEFPQYDWNSNKGYGSQKHYDAIKEHGITPLHRKSFLTKIVVHW